MSKKYTKLFIIGNGFDRWQGLPTSYEDFKKFYNKNVENIASELNVEVDKTTAGNIITPVELLYGDILKPSELPQEFFWNFEAATALIDDQKLINNFEKSYKGLYQLQQLVDDAQRILRKAFCDWIKSIHIIPANTGYSFDENCYFINFNYTDTLEKRFNVNNVNYIHGNAGDDDSIIFGHSTHPELAFPELIEQKLVHNLKGGKSKRLEGLYFIEDALYSTDKHIQDNIDDLCEFMTLDGVHIEDLTDIYVLGHSFAETDYEYFYFLVKATQKGVDFNELSAIWKARKMLSKLPSEQDILEFYQMNILYATNHRKRVIGKENLSFPFEELIEKIAFEKNNIYTDHAGNVHDVELTSGREAVYKRFILEQSVRTKEVIEELFAIKGKKLIPEDCCSVFKAASYLDGGHTPRKQDAMWHISYFNDKDKSQIETVMKKSGCKRFELKKSIDECISVFKKE